MLQNVVLSHKFHPWNKKEAIFDIKYEIVLRAPYSKARCGAATPWSYNDLGDLFFTLKK